MAAAGETLLVRPLFLLASCLALTKCQKTRENGTLKKQFDCNQLLSNATTDGRVIYEVDQDNYNYCLQHFFWKEENEFNLTEQEQAYVNSIITSVFGHRRSKRSTKSQTGPDTGFRIRKEYRCLTDQERDELHLALNIMYKKGQYKTFAKMHGIAKKSAHGGTSFLAWHRIFLVLFEEALRKNKPNVAIPYWDLTLDFDMEDPVDSIIWYDNFLGNGDGPVITGPFAGWKAHDGQLTRHIGRKGSLIPKYTVGKILSRCFSKEILNPTARDKYSIEHHHNGAHSWMGGHMSIIKTAAYDPVFFLLHSFIDYLYELFRNKQSSVCDVDPTKDYPYAKGRHSAKSPMLGFKGFRNIDGISSKWTKYWYRYEPAPTCSEENTSCGSPYLYCDKKRMRCVSEKRPRKSKHGGSNKAVRKVRSEETSVNFVYGVMYRSPPADPRTIDGQNKKLKNNIF